MTACCGGKQVNDYAKLIAVMPLSMDGSDVAMMLLIAPSALMVISRGVDRTGPTLTAECDVSAVYLHGDPPCLKCTRVTK